MVFLIKKETRLLWFHFSFKYSSIAVAAFLPAPIALITVAAPVTTSPPAKTPHLEVAPVSSSATTVPLLFCSRPSEPLKIMGFGDVPMAIITTSAGIVNSEPSTGTGLLLS